MNKDVLLFGIILLTPVKSRAKHHCISQFLSLILGGHLKESFDVVS